MARTGNVTHYRGFQATILIAIWSVVLGIAASSAGATAVPLGTANGGVSVYYNNNAGGENPANQAYLRAQFSYGNTNGAVFNFDNTPLPGTNGALSWYGVFQSVPNQFGVDVVLQAPTWDGTVATPVLDAFDNVNGSIAGRANAGPVTWAISGYTGSTDGPGNPANSIINSVLRGGTGNNDGVTLTMGPVMQSGNLFTVAVSGELLSDNLVHWYNPSTPNSPVANLQLTGKLFFSGTLTYDSTGDTGTDLRDFYAGTVAVSAEVICGTRYVDQTAGQDFSPAPNFCRTAGSPCKTIQHTVDVSCPGDTVNVASGTYAEQVSIPKSLTVIGAGKTTTFIQAPPSLPAAGTIVTVQGAGVGVEMSGFTVRGPGPSNCGSIRAGIEVLNGADADLHDDAVADIRDQPFGGCQNGLGIIVGSSTASASATITNNMVVGYQKGGIVVRRTGSTATITGNVVTGVGATPAIAQNGIQVSDGAVATVTGNQVSGNQCDHATCGPDPVADYQSIGVLLAAAGGGTTVSGNTVSSNDIGIYNWADGPTSITGNTVQANRYEGIYLDEGNATVASNRIDGGNTGLIAVSFDGSAGNSAGTLTCNRISGAGEGIRLIDDQLADGNIPTVTAHSNSISGNGVGANNPTAATVNAENNYWGCANGPGFVGCDTVAGNVDADPSLDVPAPCVPSTEDINVTKVRLRRKTSAVDNSSAAVKGDFLLGPTEVFDASNGVTITIEDSLSSSVTHAWTAAECTPFHGGVRCRSVDRSRAIFRPIPPTPTVVKFNIRIRPAGLTGPFLSPVTVRIVHGAGINRIGVIMDCKASNAGLNCREF